MNESSEMTDVLAAAKALAPEIRARADEIEKGRQLPQDLAKTMARAGLFRMLVPAHIGGLESDPWTIVETIEAAATADASAGWCVMIAATTCLKSAFLDEDVARDIYGDPNVICGGVFQPAGRAQVAGTDFVVSGQWQWASGSPNCDWLSGGCLVVDDGEVRKLPNGVADARMVIFPAAEATLLDDWHVAGLCGSGSGSMVVDNLRVAQRYSVSIVTDKPKMGGALYAFPSFGMLALGVASVALGNAQAALDDLIGVAANKTPQASRRVLAKRAHAQVALAEKTAALRSARCYAEDCVGQAWDDAKGKGEISVEARTNLRLACTHAVRTGADVCRAMYELGGGSSLFLTSPLQRRFRDAYAMTQHMITAPATYELTGRILMGLETDHTFL